MYDGHKRGFLGSNLARRWLCACALYCVSLASGAVETVGSGGFDRFLSLATGAGSQTLSFASGGVPVITDTHTGGVKVGNMGAYVHPTTSGALELRGSGRLPVGNGTMAFTAKSTITARNLGKAVAALATGPLGIAILTAPAILDLISDAGMTTDLVTGQVSDSGQYWHVYTGSCLYQTSREAAGLCGALQTWAGTTANQWQCTVTNQTTNQVFCQFLDVPTSRSYTVQPEAGAMWGGVRTAQQIEDAIATSGVSDPWVLHELYSKNQPVDVENVVASVPTTVQGPQSVTTDPQGTTTIDTKWDCISSGSLVTCNQVKTTTRQLSGVDPGTGQPYAPEVTTETTDSALPDADACAANPSRVGCATLDLPTDTVPTSEVTVTFSAEDLGLGAGGCPAPIGFNVATGSYSLNLSSWCDAVETWVRPLVIAIATLMAFMIAWPRGES
jgi:hypothetical protein